MSFETIDYKLDGAVAVVTLNMPDKLNALSKQMQDELAQVVCMVRDNEEVRVLVITGAGRAFCAGGDLNAQAKVTDEVSARKRIKNLHLWVVELINLEKPVIAAVNGFAVGAGCNLAFACDLIYACEEAKFSEIFSKIGVIPDAGGLYFLPWTVGPARAKEIVFTGRMVDAAEAYQIGLVNKVLPKEKLLSEVMTLAYQLAEGPGVAYGLAKTIINKSNAWDLNTLLEAEANAQAICTRTQDCQEGRTAFFEKRKPVFKCR